MGTKKAVKKEIRLCGWKDPKPCTVKLNSGHQKWCPRHKQEVRKKQNQKSAKRYASKWGNQRLTTKQTAMIKLVDEKAVKGKKTIAKRPTAKASATHKRESQVLVGGVPVEVIT